MAMVAPHYRKILPTIGWAALGLIGFVAAIAFWLAIFGYSSTESMFHPDDADRTYRNSR